MEEQNALIFSELNRLNSLLDRHARRIDSLVPPQKRKDKKLFSKFYGIFAATLTTICMAFLLLTVSPVLFSIVTPKIAALLVVLFSSIPNATIVLSHTWLKLTKWQPDGLLANFIAAMLAILISTALEIAFGIMLPTVPFTAPVLISLTIAMGIAFGLTSAFAAFAMYLLEPIMDKFLDKAKDTAIASTEALASKLSSAVVKDDGADRSITNALNRTQDNEHEEGFASEMVQSPHKQEPK